MRRILVLVLIACARSSAPPSPSTTSLPSSTVPEQASIPPPPLPPPLAAPHVEVRAGSAPGEVEIIAAADVDLDGALGVEREVDGGFEDITKALDLGGMKLVERCGAVTPKCVHLVKGQTLRPVRWSGYSCSAQCNGSCRANAYYGNGRFRFFVKTCDGARRFESTVFQFPQNPPPM